MICPYLGKEGKQDFVLSLRFGNLLFYVPVLETVALSFSTCLSIGTVRCAGRRCSIIIYVLIYLAAITVYLPSVLWCLPGSLFNDNEG